MGVGTQAAVWLGQQEQPTPFTAGLRKGLPSHVGLRSYPQVIVSRYLVRNDSLGRLFIRLLDAPLTNRKDSSFIKREAVLPPSTFRSTYMPGPADFMNQK